jgi:hypothetical protein
LQIWNDRIIEARFKIKRGHLTIRSLYALEEDRIEEADKFYQQLQEITGKINKNDYILLMADSNFRDGNQRLGKTMQTPEQYTYS